MADDVDLDERALREVIREVAEKEIDRRLDIGARYWEEHARRRTGYMAKAVEKKTVGHGDGTVEGELHMLAHYSGYQEFGTRYIEGMHLSADIVRVMERG